MNRELDKRCEEVAEEYGLTERESEILMLLSRDKRPKEISEILVVSLATVRSHVQGIYSKTGAHSYEELDKLLNKR
ncbi:helix-turn-helix transcriptional regulator [Eggerthellaceae bacterium 3-80]|nr:LuxR family transcriptional regulator [bacterium D16-34]